MVSDDRLRILAAQLRVFFGVSGQAKVDAQKCLSFTRIQTVAGGKALDFEIVAPADVERCGMLGLDALTINSSHKVTIKLTTKVHAGIIAGKARDIFTLAHELAHGALCHPREALARTTRTGAYTPISGGVWKYEKEADRFASFFLVDEERAEDCNSSEALARRFGVSLAFAEKWFAERASGEARARISVGFQELLGKLGSQPRAGQPHAVSAAPELRPVSGRLAMPAVQGQTGRLRCYCTHGTLIPTLSGKFQCDSCGRVSEIPDGDG